MAISEEKKQKVIIEGILQDDTSSNHVDTDTLRIPSGVTKLNVHHYGCSELDWVAMVNKDGMIEAVPATDREGMAYACMPFEYQYDGSVQAPLTVLSEDGRIFHNRETLYSKTHCRRDWLASFLYSCQGRFETRERFGRFYSDIRGDDEKGCNYRSLNELNRIHPLQRCLIEGDKGKDSGFQFTFDSLDIPRGTTSINLSPYSGECIPGRLSLVSKVKGGVVKKITGITEKDNNKVELQYISRGIAPPFIVATEDGRIFFNSTEVEKRLQGPGIKVKCFLEDRLDEFLGLMSQAEQAALLMKVYNMAHKYD